MNSCLYVFYDDKDNELYRCNWEWCGLQDAKLTALNKLGNARENEKSVAIFHDGTHLKTVTYN